MSVDYRRLIGKFQVFFSPASQLHLDPYEQFKPGK
jgi:hypothetical protein